MKKLLLIALLALASMAQAQTITIGEGTGQTTQVPFNTFANYSFTEQLYLASDIEFAGYIKAIKFRIAYEYNSDAHADLNVYLKNVTRSSFSSPSDYEAVTANDLVFSGIWTIPANTNDWMTINFDTPFYYNGTDNLLIAIDENSASYDIRYFRYTEVNGASLSYADDNVNPDPYDLDLFTGIKEVVNQRANTKLVFDQNVVVGENHVDALSVYPNPANDDLFLDGVEGEMVRVYDAMGRMVLQTCCTGQLFIGSLENGVYAVSTSRGVVRFVKK